MEYRESCPRIVSLRREWARAYRSLATIRTRLNMQQGLRWAVLSILLAGAAGVRAILKSSEGCRDSLLKELTATLWLESCPQRAVGVARYLRILDNSLTKRARSPCHILLSSFQPSKGDIIPSAAQNGQRINDRIAAHQAAGCRPGHAIHPAPRGSLLQGQQLGQSTQRPQAQRLYLMSGTPSLLESTTKRLGLVGTYRLERW